MRLTRAQNVLHFARKLFKIASVSGAPPQTPLQGLTTLPQTPYIVVRGFLPSAIAASRLRCLQFPRHEYSGTYEICLAPHGLKSNSAYEEPIKKVRLDVHSVFPCAAVEPKRSLTSDLLTFGCKVRSSFLHRSCQFKTYMIKNNGCGYELVIDNRWIAYYRIAIGIAACRHLIFGNTRVCCIMLKQCKVEIQP